MANCIFGSSKACIQGSFGHNPAMGKQALLVKPFRKPPTCCNIGTYGTWGWVLVATTATTSPEPPVETEALSARDVIRTEIANTTHVNHQIAACRVLYSIQASVHNPACSNTKTSRTRGILSHSLKKNTFKTSAKPSTMLIMNVHSFRGSGM